MIDFVVDNYFNLIESIEEEIRFLQDSILKQPKESDLNEINRLKKLLVQVRRMIQPLENVLPELSRLGASYIKRKYSIFSGYTGPCIHSISNLDSLKEELNVILEIYLTRISMKLNEVMKVLTLISTIFIPLTFIAGIYGMNFRYMPELEVKYAYPITLTAMVALALSMVSFFKWKKWI